jgi:hypothetical protein
MASGSTRFGVQRDATAPEACCRSPLQVGVRYQVKSSAAKLLGQRRGLERHPIKQEAAVDATLKC